MLVLSLVKLLISHCSIIFLSLFQIKAKNQLRVNGLSFLMYFATYFLVLIGLMLLICAALLIIILLFDIPSLKDWPSLLTLGTLIFLYCPSSILFSTCVSYIFDKTDSAQSILPNIATFLGYIPFFLVIILDMLRIGKENSANLVLTINLNVFFNNFNVLCVTC